MLRSGKKRVYAEVFVWSIGGPLSSVRGESKELYGKTTYQQQRGKF